MRENPWNTFCDPYWELTCQKKGHPRTLGISTAVIVACATHFHVQHGTKTNQVILPTDGEASWILLPSSLLTIKWHDETKKHLLLCPQGDRSGLRKPY